MKNRFLKLFILLTLTVAMVASLAACASTATADDASGQWQDISWNYFKDTKTLTISGSGSIPDADTPDGVSWTGVRGSVERVVFSSSSPITSIGSYAFYGMSKLTDIDIPDTVTSIGKCAFAFCSSLDTVSMSANSSLISVDESAFEACSSLESIKLPSTVTSIGNRAFAFCRQLKIVLIAGAPTEIGHWAFKDCSSLSSLAISNASALQYADTAFEGASSMSSDKVVPYSESIIVNVHYKDADGNEVRQSLTEMKAFGDIYSYVAPTIDGYTVSGDAQYAGTVGGEGLEFTFTYTKNAETEAPVETEQVTEPVEEEEDNPTVTIIALVIFAVVLGGIGVGAVLLIRSDKKQKKNGTTVRKNQGDKNDKNRYRKK